MALESIKNFEKDVIVGVHLKDTGKLPSGENITGLKKILSKYKIRAVIGGCISPEIYQKVSIELKELNYEYGFKINAFENIPDNWSITPNANPNLSLGKRSDLDSDSFVDFCNLWQCNISFFGQASVFTKINKYEVCDSFGLEIIRSN